MKLYYFAARLRSHDPAVQDANLRHAQERLELLRPSFRARGIHLWAPWIDMAIAGVSDADAVRHNSASLMVSDGIVVDVSDGVPMSDGVIDEVRTMLALGKVVECAR